MYKRQAYSVPACLVFNKTDLYSESEFEYLEALEFLYESLGYTVFKVSAKNNTDLDTLTQYLDNKISLISGNSGVGKSTRCV